MRLVLKYKYQYINRIIKGNRSQRSGFWYAHPLGAPLLPPLPCLRESQNPVSTAKRWNSEIVENELEASSLH